MPTGWTAPFFRALYANDLPFNLAPSLHIALRSLLWVIYVPHIGSWLLRNAVRIWFLLIGLSGLTLSAPVSGQRPDDQIAPKSLELQRQARQVDAHRGQAEILEAAVLEAARSADVDHDHRNADACQQPENSASPRRRQT